MMKTHCIGWSFLMLAWACPYLSAQTVETEAPPLTLTLTGSVTDTTVCKNTVLSNQLGNGYLFQLPTLKTTSLTNGLFSDVTPLDLQVNVKISASNCTNPTTVTAKLVFDKDLAGIAPRTGLLRNNATNNPAQNVFVQLGLINAAGMFNPIDLNQPQQLNLALNQTDPLTKTFIPLRLAVRYVASRSFAAQNASLQAGNPGSQDVSAGNVSVYLPFLLKLD
jgi:hypothetical protein